jgi:transcription antitermination factor NusG
MINSQMRDLLEKLTLLTEAPVQPGEKKEISFTLKKLDKVTSKLSEYKKSLQYMESTTLPPDMQKKMQELQDELNIEIGKVQAAYDDAYSKSFTASGTPLKMENLFKGLQKNCKEIIKVYQDLNGSSFKRQKFLYRGIRSRSDALYGKPFEARKPKDSNSELHTMLNDAMKNAGFTARRDNSTFTTGDRGQASGYGNSLYILFPVDGFKYTWSRTEKDLVLDSGKRMALLDKNVLKKLRTMITKAKKDNPDKDISDSKYMFVDSYDYNTNVREVQRLIDDGTLPKTAQDLLDGVLSEQSMLDYFDFTDKNLFEAITSYKEIYLDGPYYAVNVDHVKELVKFLQKVDTDSVELPEDFGTPPNTIDEGDIVKILKGPHKDKLGIVTYTYSASYEIKIQNDENDITVDKQDVELYKLPDGTTPVFNDNDKVIVTNPNSYLYGDIGRIAHLYSSGKTDFIPETDPNNSFYVWTNELALYTPELATELSGKPKPHKFTIGDMVTITDDDSGFNGQTGKITYIYSGPKYEVTFGDGSEYSFLKNQFKLADKDNIKTDLEPIKTKDFKIGDKVKVLTGPHAGKTGTVDYVYASYPEITVVFDDGTGNPDINVSNLEKITGSETSSDSSIKVGDIVQIINIESSYYGQVGEVIEVGQNENGKAWIRFKPPTMPSGVKTFADWVEKVDKPTEFQVGDKVKINWEPSSYNGKTGKIELGPDSDGDYRVLADGGGLAYVPASGLQKIEDTADTKTTSTTLEVGDTVKLTGPSAYNNSSYIGYSGTITSVSDDGKFAGVQLDPDTVLTYEVTNLSTSTSDETALKKGDTVKVTEYGSLFNGMIGVIDKGPDSDGDFVVMLPNGKWGYFKPNVLQKVDTKKDTTTAPTINVYDTVKNIKSGHPNFGQLGKVQTVYSSGNIGLVYSDNTQAIDPPSYLKKVDGPPAPTQSQFGVGDRVEVASQYPSLIGMTGTVTQVSPNYEVVSVQLDGNTAASSIPAYALKKSIAPELTEELHLGDTVKVTNAELSSYDMEGKIVDIDASIITIQYGDQPSDVIFVKKSSVKKIG